MVSRRRLTALVGALVTLFAALGLGATAVTAAPPYGHHAHISCNPRANEHAIIHCDGDGYLPNEPVQISLHTKTYPLGVAHTDANGAFSDKALRLPQGVTGTHTIIGKGRGYLVNGDPDDIASTTIIIDTLGTGGTGDNNGGPSNTGVAVIGISVLGLALLVGGTMFVLAGRRRQDSTV
jgi:hypothetical protein